MTGKSCQGVDGTGDQRRVLANVSSPNRQHIILPLRNGAIVLEVHCPIGEAVLKRGDCIRRALDVHVISADVKIVVCARRFIRKPPVRSHAANIESKIRSGIRLRSSDVLGTIERAGKIQVIVPHGVAAETGHVLPQRSIDYGCSRWRWSNVAGGERKTPGRRAVPQVLNRWIVVERDPIGELLAEQTPSVGSRTDVSIVPTEVIGLRIVCDLNEAAYVTSPGARKKYGGGLRELEVAVLSIRLLRFRRAERSIE